MELIVYCDNAIDKLTSIDMKGSDKCYEGDEPRRSGERHWQRRGREGKIFGYKYQKGPLYYVPVNQSTLRNKRKVKEWIIWTFGKNIPGQYKIKC